MGVPFVWPEDPRGNGQAEGRMYPVPEGIH
jgi:hypothetical protein